MKNYFKIILSGATILLLNGCFIAGQIHDKIYEDCYVSPDYIQSLSPDEYQLLAKKCGWKP